MEQLKWTTPVKAEKKLEHFSPASPAVYNTPVKQNKMKSKYNLTGNRNVLPHHITPPSGLTKFIARNPFETDLTNRLHLSVMSPTVFSKTASIVQNSQDFTWSIEELALMQPAKIEEFPTEQAHPVDPELELKAQRAIDQFFQENQIIPSPWELKKRETKFKNKANASRESTESLNHGTNMPKTKKEAFCQTTLSLPPQLPLYIEEILKPYFLSTQEHHNESDDANSSNSSLRRKLFFNHDEPENDVDSSIILSPVKIDGSLILSSSPPQSGMFIHGIPVTFQQNTRVSIATSDSLSPPNMSPIHSINASYNTVKCRSNSIAKIDMTTDMSIDASIVQTKDYETVDPLDTSLCKNNEALEKELVENFSKCDANSFSTKPNFVRNINSPQKSFAVSGSCVKDEIIFSNKNRENISLKLKNPIDYSKLNDNENFLLQQTNSSVNPEQQSVSNSVQDTGYQTCSMSSTVNATDNSNATPIKQKIKWGDRIAQHDEDLGLLDWKGSLKNIFSSTPSRSKRENDNPIF